MIEIDGSHGEGGGALLRISAALSSLTLKPTHIWNIRANRPKTGLMPQHLNALKLVARMSDASCDGMDAGSNEVFMKPRWLKGGKFSVDVGTAGSITLILQAAMIPAAFADSTVEITLRGGTDVKWAPSVDYLKNVTLPTLSSMGFNGEIHLIQRGHYPRGGGILKARINPIKKLKPLKLLDLELDVIKGVSHAVKLPEHVAVRQAKSAEKTLRSAGYIADIEVQHSEEGLGPGSGIVLWIDGKTRLSGSDVGAPGRRAELVGQKAAEELIYHISQGAALDRYMGDQIIPYMALAGRSHVKTAQLTKHALTNIYATEKFTNKQFQVEGSPGDIAEISVD
jgi:RNA 3'-terminal phosphate cyclase (ATP)